MRSSTLSCLVGKLRGEEKIIMAQLTSRMYNGQRRSMFHTVIIEEWAVNKYTRASGFAAARDKNEENPIYSLSSKLAWHDR